MSYKIIPTEHFKQEVQRLQKAYPRIKADLKVLHDMLTTNPKCGISLGGKVYKIRLHSSDMTKGKSGGFRVISYVIDEMMTIRLLTIYAKSKKTTIHDDEICQILKEEGLL